MYVTQSPITVPAESRLHLTPGALALVVALTSMGVAMMGSDDSPAQPQQVRIVQPVGYGSGV